MSSGYIGVHKDLHIFLKHKGAGEIEGKRKRGLLPEVCHNNNGVYEI